MRKAISLYDAGFRNELKQLREGPQPGRQFISLDSTADALSNNEQLTAFAARIEHMAASGAGVSARDLERYIGRNDLLHFNYLSRGLKAGHPVCRVRINDPFGAGGAWGSGFMVSPRLLLTNNHVLGSAEEAGRAFAEFGYEADAMGQLQQGKRFQFAPDAAFLTNVDLDFTLVAVAEQGEDGVTPLSDYGFLRLDPNLHKVDENEFVSIIQHPEGDEKYVSIRENRVLKIGDPGKAKLDNWVWYASDTAPGSSGAPVFNDNWQLVAIHHSGIPEVRTHGKKVEYQRTDGTWISKDDAGDLPDDQIKWIANEGVRTSKLLAKVAELQSAAGASQVALIQDFLNDANGVVSFPGTAPRESLVVPPLRLARSIEASPDLPQDGVALPSRAAAKPAKHIHPLSYYSGRTGYDPAFLDANANIPLPELSPTALHFGSPAPVQGAEDNILRYTHFSILFNAERRMPFFTAVNIDGRTWNNIKRGVDVWFYDPRLAMELQVGEELYGDEPAGDHGKGWFDRGHLVRRQDPAWDTRDIALLADDDTFHWANCSPQYWGFNQGGELWAGLENFILYNTDKENVRASVFSGPLFEDDDQEHRHVLIPQYFWKVVAVVDGAGKLYTSAYVVDQSKWARDIPFEVLPVGEYNHFQVPVADLEKRTGLTFSDNVRAADVMTPDTPAKPLRSLADVINPRRS